MGLGASKPKEPRIIVVFGATGNQGNSVVRSFVGDAKFKVKAVTRDPESDKAKALADAGAEVVKADYGDAESLRAALEGAYGVFAVTNFWESMDKDKEIEQGKAIADACKECKVSHVVWSSAEDRESPIFSGKAEVGKYMQSIGLHVTVAIYAFYYENLLGMMKPQKGEDDVFTIGIPMEGKPLPMVSVVDSGKCVYQIFKDGKKHFDKSIALVGHKATVEEYAEILSNNLEGMTFKAGEMTAEHFGQQEFPGAAILATLFETIQHGNLDREVATTKRLCPDVMDFPSWVKTKQEEFKALE